VCRRFTLQGLAYSTTKVKSGACGRPIMVSRASIGLLATICPAPSVRLIYGWGGVVPFMVRTRRIRERVYHVK